MVGSLWVVTPPPPQNPPLSERTPTPPPTPSSPNEIREGFNSLFKSHTGGFNGNVTQSYPRIAPSPTHSLEEKTPTPPLPLPPLPKVPPSAFKRLSQFSGRMGDASWTLWSIWLYFSCFHVNLQGPWWQSGNTLASHLWGQGSVPGMASSGKTGSCLPLAGSLQYRTLTNCMYWFPLPFQLPVVIWPVQCWKRRKTPNK